MSPKIDQQRLSEINNDRRDFLRQSVYAAYATPVMVALLVDKASAVASGRTGGTVDPVLPPPPSK